MNFEYSEQEYAKKCLKKAKRGKYVFNVIIVLLLSMYVLFVVSGDTTKGLLSFAIMLLILELIIVIVYYNYAGRKTLEKIQVSICPEAFLNLTIFYNKLNSKRKINRSYKYAVHNVAYAYIVMGDCEKATELLTYLESYELDDRLKAAVLRNWLQIAFIEGDVQKFYEYESKLKTQSEKVSKLGQTYMKEAALKKAILENNTEEAIKALGEMNFGKTPLDKLTQTYYKGLIYKKCNNEEYKAYYKYVSENGNNIRIAQEARNDLGITENHNIYKQKKHRGIKVLSVITIILFLTADFLIADELYERHNISWDTGIVRIAGADIQLPCSVKEFENTFNVVVDEPDMYNFTSVYILERKIDLYVKNDFITGIKVTISNYWNDDLDTVLGGLVVFPENVTANDDFQEVQEKYKTGPLNYYLNTFGEYLYDGTYSENIKYSGQYYSISIDLSDGKITSIFYYYK